MSQRSKSDWIRELRGDYGSDVQRQTHHDLANYLNVVTYNNLRLRQPGRLDLAVGVDIPSRGGWPNLDGSSVMLRRGAEVLDAQETDAFGKVVFDDVPADDLPMLAFEIAVQ